MITIAMGSIKDEEASWCRAGMSSLTWAQLIYGPQSSNALTANQLARFLAEHASKDYNIKLAEIVTASSKDQIDATIEEPPFMLEFAELFHMNIIDLGKQLLEARRDIINNREATEEARKHVSRLLHEYCTHAHISPL